MAQLRAGGVFDVPTIVGTALADASGTALQDASAELLGEPDMEVYLAPQRILYAGNQPPGPGWPDLVDLFANAVMVATIQAIVEDVQAKVQTLYTRYYQQLGDELQAIALNEADINSMADNAATRHQAVLDAIAAIDPGGLTTEEHDQLLGLENADPAVIASNVWGYVIAVDDLRQTLGGLGAAQVLENLWYAALVQTGFSGIRAAHNPWFAYIAYSPSDAAGAFGDYLSGSDPTFLPSLDLTLVVEGDTVWTYLTREYGAWTWTRKGPGDNDDGSQVWLGTDGVNTVAGWRCLLTDADLAGIWREQEIPDPAAMDLPPVWPGSANVTLGEPVALVDQLNLVGTMDGVLVNVTTPPTKTGVRSVGGALYDYNVGEIAFETDGGEIEPWQYMGFRSAIFTPKTMTSAAGARFRVLAGAAGTVTPWTRS